MKRYSPILIAWVVPAICLVACLFTATPAAGQTFTLSHSFDDPTPSDHFGGSVALEGNYVLVGVDLDDATGHNKGEAHLFNAATGSLLQTFSNPIPEKAEGFGQGVALDGNYALIGSTGNFTGSAWAHLFDVTTGNLLRTFPSPESGVGFSEYWGAPLALDANHVLIGDQYAGEGGQAYLFNATTGGLLHTFDDSTVWLGNYVALDGDHMLISNQVVNTQGDRIGQVRLFDTSGNLLQTFDNPMPGAGNSGRAFGASTALDANHVLIADWRIGQVYLFDTSGNLLHTFDDPTPTTGGIGGSVAVDGNWVLISDPGSGQAHLFDTSGNLLQTFDDPTPTEDSFGWPVDLDAGRILIGDRLDDTNGLDVGQAHLFEMLSLPGDYNGNGVVDAADYVVWRDNLGAPAGTLPNDVQSGPIGQAQYDTWKANFGANSVDGSAASPSSVPEPDTWMIILGLMVGEMAIRSRRITARS